ncbi:MAG: squalene/phytoene synthase family protein [Sphingorhabdus sp.]|uniref:squalene/phytoene synthase family protein n=1 Tax=Sphingorhabdus sp. TaxID=1902408 RepID=UPI0025EBF771|nr:squalene/phytoene synthase family protein [Sphingorhabdus sp.]MCO4091788.1 squalene/phytoene synthase family protein [Sphingorhabdus sp.]
MMTDPVLELAPPARLAIAYAPSDVRSAFALLLQIDNRFAEILRNAREPMIAQIKMAWWREAFASAADARPKGEPLLQALNEAGDRIPLSALEALASAWEALLGSERFNQEVIDVHAELRAEAIFSTYAGWMGTVQDMRPIGRSWALEALRTAFPDRVAGCNMPPAPLPKARALRPLSILTMSVRTVSGPRLILHALTGI